MAEKSIQELVESAYDEAESNAASADSTQPPDAGGGPDSTAVAPVVASGGTDGGDGGPVVASESSAAAQRARDAAGKFTKAAKETASKQGGITTAPAVPGSVSPTEAGAAPVEVAPVAEAVKAPQSLTPAEREAFAKATPEIQRAFARIDQTVRLANQEAAPAKKFKAEVEQALQPYAQFAQSIGQTPIGLAQQASQIALQISTAPPNVAAQLLANLVRSRPDMTLEMLAGALDAPQQQPQPQHMDPRTIAAQVRQEVMQSFQQERAAREEARLTQELEAFAADPANEHFEKVGHETLAILNAAKVRGQPISLKDAYESAAWANPVVRAIMQKRAAQEAAKANQASMQQARAAASSVKSTPSTGASSARAPKTDRERVEAAYDAVYGGQ